MKGRAAVEKIGRKVIELVRQNCMAKYGSGMLNEKQARKISEFQDQERCFDARNQIQRYRLFYYQQSGVIKWLDNIKLLAQVQAGNCYEMASLTRDILEQIIPRGIKLQLRLTTEDVNDNQCHEFICLKPLNAIDDKETLVIDPWPSYQLIEAEVVAKEDYFLKYPQRISPKSFSKQSNMVSKEDYQNFDNIDENMFNIKALMDIQKIITKKEHFVDPKWQKILYQTKLIPDNLLNAMMIDEWYKLFKYRRRNVKYVNKHRK